MVCFSSTLLVTMNGKVEAANAAGAALLDRDPAAVPEKHLTDFAAEGAASLQAYLQACARSTSLLPGAMTLVNHSGLREPCRMQDALFQSAAEGASALILLKLNRRYQANRFIELNRRIDELAREVQRRRQAEADLSAQERLLRVTLSSIGDAPGMDGYELAKVLRGRTETRGTVPCRHRLRSGKRSGSRARVGLRSSSDQAGGFCAPAGAARGMTPEESRRRVASGWVPRGGAR